MKRDPVIKWQNTILRIPGEAPSEVGDLMLCANDRIGFIGPSGAGKTTLMRVLAGLSDPAPRVVFKGRSLDFDQWPGLRSRVIYLHQQAQFPAATIEENLKRPFEFQTNSGKKYSPETVIKLMNRLGLKHLKFNQPIDQLSQGERQRLSLIRALQLNPSVLLLDEPTSALDHEATLAVENLLLQWSAKPGKALIIISHHDDQLKRLTSQTWKIDVSEGRRQFHAE